MCCHLLHSENYFLRVSAPLQVAVVDSSAAHAFVAADSSADSFVAVGFAVEPSMPQSDFAEPELVAVAQFVAVLTVVGGAQPLAGENYQ